MSIKLEWSDQHRIAEVLIDAPKGNSLDSSALRDLHGSLAAVQEDSAVRAAVISGVGDDFCSGRIPTAGLSSAESLREDLSPVLDVNRLLDRFRVPVIAAIEGKAFGFGFGLVTLTDLTIVGSDSRFALTELRNGIPPLIVMSYFAKFVPYKVALDLAITGREIDAHEAQRLGLATQVVSPGRSLSVARELAERIAEFDPKAVMLLRGYARRQADLLDEVASSAGADEIAKLLAARSAES